MKKDKSEYNVNIVWLGVALSHTFHLIYDDVSRDTHTHTSLLTKKINNDLLLNVCYVEIQLQSVWYMSWWWGDLLRNIGRYGMCVCDFGNGFIERRCGNINMCYTMLQGKINCEW